MEEEECYSNEFDKKIEDQIEKNLKEEIVAISVDSYKIEEGRVKNHVVYIIRGQDSQGPFEASRRYKEFQSLRLILTINWPACYIPKLPPKKAMGNLKTDLIHKRKKLLEYFITKIVIYKHYYRSECFQIFIRGENDFIKSSSSLKPLLYSEIKQNFDIYFPSFNSFVISSESEQIISQAYQVFKESLTKLKKFKKACKLSAISFYRYENSLASFSTGINQLMQYFFPAKEPGVDIKTKVSNPYKILLDWSRREVIEVESLIEVIDKKINLESLISKDQTKIAKRQQAHENFTNGKKSFLQRFSKKPDEETAKKLEADIIESEKELNALKEIIRVATGRLVEYQLPLFKEKQVEKLESTIRSYTGLTIEEYTDFIKIISIL